MSTENYIKIAQLKSVEAFQQRSKEIGAEIPMDEAVLTAAEASPTRSSAGPLHRRRAPRPRSTNRYGAQSRRR